MSRKPFPKSGAASGPADLPSHSREATAAARPRPCGDLETVPGLGASLGTWILDFCGCGKRFQSLQDMQLPCFLGALFVHVGSESQNVRANMFEVSLFQWSAFWGLKGPR